MSKRPTMTLADVRRAIDAQNRQLADAHETARGRRVLPVTRAQLKQLAEACEPRVTAAPSPVLPDWTMIRC